MFFSGRYFSYLLLIISLNSQAQELHYFGSKNKYTVELLTHVLSYRPRENYQLIPFTEDMRKKRAFTFLAKKQVIDIVFAGATKQRMKKFQAIEFPLLKGLNGWRVPVVLKANHNLFQTLDSMNKFKQLTPGLLYQWSDKKIMAFNNIDVTRGSSIEGLWGMLAKDRFDYFPRSILQVEQEVAVHNQLDIMIEPTTLIHYPTAYYFYVNKQNSALAEDIELGLEAALADGSFDEIFTRHYGKIINDMQSQQRKVFHLVNPLLPENTPLQRKEFWLDLSTNN